jgi:hypothetical protein
LDLGCQSLRSVRTALRLVSSSKMAIGSTSRAPVALGPVHVAAWDCFVQAACSISAMIESQWPSLTLGLSSPPTSKEATSAASSSADCSVIMIGNPGSAVAFASASADRMSCCPKRVEKRSFRPAAAIDGGLFRLEIPDIAAISGISGNFGGHRLPVIRDAKVPEQCIRLPMPARQRRPACRSSVWDGVTQLRPRQAPGCADSAAASWTCEIEQPGRGRSPLSWANSYAAREVGGHTFGLAVVTREAC